MENHAKHLALLLLLITESIVDTTAFLKCCPDDYYLVNSTCSDGSNITALSCKVRVLMGPTVEAPSVMEIDEDDTLIITDKNDVGSLRIMDGSYCITRQSENGTDVALVCIDVDDEPAPLGRRILYYLKLVFAFTSAMFFLIVLIIYLFVPDLRDIEGKCILNFVAPLFIAHVFLTFDDLILYFEHRACDAITFLNYATVLCCYNWLSIMSFHVWRITIRPIFKTQMQWFPVYMCYGYGLPALLLATALIHHYTQEIDSTTAELDCILSGGLAIWTYFYGPLMVMILVGTVLLIWASKKMWMDIDRRDTSQSVLRLRKKCLTCIYLMLVTGSMAILDILYARMVSHEDTFGNYIWEISDCRNLVVGVVVFCILVVMRNKVLKALAKRGLFCIKFPQSWSKLVDDEREELENDEATLTQYSSGL